MSRAWVAAMVVVGVATTAVATAQTPEWPRESMPRPLAARGVKFPPYEVQTLDNGLRVVVVQHHEQPVVSGRLIVRAGSASDPKDKLGLATLAAALLDQGAGGKTAKDIADTIDFLGGTLNAGAATDLTYLNMVVMKDSFEQGLSMLSDIARRPAFAPAELDRQRSQMLSSMRVSLDDPDYVANAVFDRLVYGFHPYGLPANGTPESVQAITRDDLVAFHQKYFAPNNAIMAIVGDVTPGEAFAMARKVFGGWEKRDVPTARYIDPPDPTRRVIVVDKPEAVQTEVRVGHIGVPRSSKDYMAVNLAIRILGGEGSNRLHQVLRTEKGLTYGAQASMDALKESGDFEAQTNTRTEATGEVLRIIVDEFWHLQRERVGEGELNSAKAYMTGNFPLTIETPEAIAQQVLNTLFYDLPVEELQTYRDRVNAVTPDDVQRVAKAYLRPDRLSVVLVGNAAKFASQLKPIGFNLFETVSLADLDLTAASFRRDKTTRGEAMGLPQAPGVTQASYRLASQQSPASPVPPRAAAPEKPAAPPVPPPVAGVPAPTRPTAAEAAALKGLIDRALAAKGGLERLKKVTTLIASDRETLTGPNGQSRTVETTTWVEYPMKVRVETRMGGTRLVQMSDGIRGWTEDPRGLNFIPIAVLNQLRASLKRDPITMLVDVAEGRTPARMLAPVREQGKRLYVVELSSEQGDRGDQTILYFDEDAQLVRLSYPSGGPDRPLIEEFFSNFKVIEGLQVAFDVRVLRGGVEIMRRTLNEVKLNTPIEPTMFRPARAGR